MLASVCILTGCQNTSGNLPGGSTQEQVNIDGTETGEITEGQYADKVFDRTLTEGKMALYVFNSHNGYVYDAGSQHSGDCMLIIAPDGTTMLIDMNSPSNASIAVDSMHKLGIEKLDYLVVSHQHLDHIGGYSTVLRYMEIGQVITNAHLYTGSNTYMDFHKLLKEKNVPVSYLYEGDTMTLGNEIHIDVYNPPRDFDYMGGTEGQNNGSLLLKMTYKNSSFLFGGDLYADQEAIILEKYADVLDVDVAKMNHHGSGTSNTKNWVKALSPKLAFAQMSAISDEMVMGRYQVAGAAILHPALDGAFVIYTDGDGIYDVQASQDRWVLDFGENEMEEGHMTIE